MTRLTDDNNFTNFAKRSDGHVIRGNQEKCDATQTFISLTSAE
jgi:hypothetical protein